MLRPALQSHLDLTSREAVEQQKKAVKAARKLSTAMEKCGLAATLAAAQFKGLAKAMSK